jgi:hypothetical protein
VGEDDVVGLLAEAVDVGGQLAGAAVELRLEVAEGEGRAPTRY